jgi:hypothetical protein
MLPRAPFQAQHSAYDGLLPTKVEIIAAECTGHRSKELHSTSELRPADVQDLDAV